MPQTFKARPTTDFAKENLFNVLRAYLDFEGLRALDLFGGTGSITLELLSRGAGRVVCVEKDYQHFSFIRKMLNTLNDPAACAVKADVLKFVPRCHEQFDLVFADPPYALPQLEDAGTRRAVCAGAWQGLQLLGQSSLRRTPSLRQCELQPV